MKRLTAAVAAIGLVATGAVVSVTGVASAVAPGNSAELAVDPPPATGFDGFGAKKAVATWGDYPSMFPGFPAIDEYLVAADRDPSFITEGDPAYGPDGADRTRKVAVTANPQWIFDDLSAGKNYHFAVYALDGSGDVIPPEGGVANTPIGYVLADGFNLSIATSRSTVLSGNAVELSGKLTTADGSPVPAGRTITVYRDVYPSADTELDTRTSEVTTTTGGRWTFKTKPRANTRYWARFTPADGIGGWTKFVSVDVRAPITLNVRPDTTIRAGRELTFRGQVQASPSLVAGLPICWQSTADGSWGGGSCGVIRDDASYALRLKPGAKADGKYRVYSGLGPAYADSKSKPVTITVR